MRISRRCLLVALLALCSSGVMSATAEASGSGGEITEAKIDNGGAISVSGRAVWEGCENSISDQGHPWLYGIWDFLEGTYWIGGSCRWRPFLTVGPGTDAADCSTPQRDLLGPPEPGIAVLWEGPIAWGKEEEERSFDLHEVKAEDAAGRLLCLATMYTGPDLCFFGSLDAVCEPGPEEMRVLASAALREPEEVSSAIDTTTSPPIIYAATSAAETPTRLPGHCRAVRASAKKKHCKKRRLPHKSFSRGKDIPVPRR